MCNQTLVHLVYSCTVYGKCLVQKHKSRSEPFLDTPGGSLGEMSKDGHFPQNIIFCGVKNKE